MTIIWKHAEIGGRKCASVNVDKKRLYVVERFGKVEAWIDGVKIGSYTDIYEAKAAVLKIRGPVADVQRPKAFCERLPRIVSEVRNA